TVGPTTPAIYALYADPDSRNFLLGHLIWLGRGNIRRPQDPAERFDWGTVAPKHRAALQVDEAASGIDRDGNERDPVVRDPAFDTVAKFRWGRGQGRRRAVSGDVAFVAGPCFSDCVLGELF